MLRGFAALLVVLFHFVLGSPDRFSELPMLQNIASYGHLGVQVFFVISGFVIPYSMYLSKYEYPNFGKFIWKRLVRLEPPYLVSILICLIIAYISTISPYYRGNPLRFSWQQLALHIGYLNAFFNYDWLNVVYWTLAIEFQYYILIAILFPIFMWKTEYSFIIALLACAYLSFLFPEKQFFFKHSPLFLFGIALFLFKVNKISFLHLSFFLLINIVFCFFSCDFTSTIFGLITFFIILFTCIKNNIFIFLGSISYSLYLLHVPIGQRILNISENFVSNQAVLAGVMIMCIAVMIFISWLFYWFVEKPSQAMSKRVVLKSSDAKGW
jgi:peptidoglycan/LPS O-acetylase OafA/YrhL